MVTRRKPGQTGDMPDAVSVGPVAQSVPVPTSEWPVELLYVHLLAKIEDLKSHLGDLRTADQIALSAALTAQKEAVQTAFVAQEKAILAALEADKRTSEIVERTNDELRELQTKYTIELRDLQTKYTENHLNQLAAAASRSAEERTHFVGVEAYAAAHTPLVNDVADLKLSRERDRGRQQAQVAILGFAFAVITVVLRFI